MASEIRAWVNSCLLMGSLCVLHYANHPSGWGLRQATILRAVGPSERAAQWEPVVLGGSVSGGTTGTAATLQAQFPLGNLGYLGWQGVPTVSLLLPTVTLLTLHFCVWSQCLLLFIFRYNLRSIKCRHLSVQFGDFFYTCVQSCNHHPDLEHSDLPDRFLVPSPKQDSPRGTAALASVVMDELSLFSNFILFLSSS